MCIFKLSIQNCYLPVTAAETDWMVFKIIEGLVCFSENQTKKSIQFLEAEPTFGFLHTSGS